MKLRGPFWQWLIPRVAAGYLRVLYATQRVEFATPNYYDQTVAQHGAAVLLLWHNRILQGSVLGIGRNLAVIISRSRDGGYISSTVERIGLTPVRGSSSRGQLHAMRELVERVKSGQSIVMTPDGPRGPCYHLQAGPIEVARVTGCPLIPVGTASTKARRVKSWDRTIIPYPFTKAIIVLGEPVFVPPETDREAREILRLQLQRTLCRVNLEAETLVGWPVDPLLQEGAAELIEKTP